MLKNLLSTLWAVILLSAFSYAQVGQGALKGSVKDAATGEPLPFVNVILELNGQLVTGGTSDFDGKFNIKPIPPGKYTLKASFTGYKPLQVNGIEVNADKITFYNISMESTVIEIEEFEVIEYTVPLISKDNTASGGTVTKEDIRRMPGRGAGQIAATVGGVYSKDDGSGDLNVRGSRSDANYYFIDGIKVRGSNAVPESAIEQVTVITGGLPAQYGDVTGGVISITTKGPSKKYFGSIEYRTSGYRIGDKMYGLDAFGDNLLEFSLSGPVLVKKDSAGNKLKPLFGFFISGNVQSTVDGSPSAIGVWKIKDDELDALNANPLRSSLSSETGAQLNADYLRLNQLEKVKTRENVARKGLNLAGKIDFATSTSTNLTVGGTVNYVRRHDYIYDFSLLNYGNNPQTITSTWRTYARFTQRFNSATQSEEERKSTSIKNAFYSIQADFTRSFTRQWDDTHKDDLFKYGYIGEFRRFQAPDFTLGTDSTTGILGNIQTTFQDTLIGFTPSDINPEAAAHTQRYYELNGWQGYDENGNPVYDAEVAGDRLERIENIQSNGGYLNGDQISNVYNMWNSSATQFNEFDESVTDQFRVTATGSADMGDHAISVGFEYEQLVQRRYIVNPRGLWTIARLRANSHTNGLDFSNPSISYPGPFITYDRQNTAPGAYSGDDAQSFFDYNLRQSLGLDPDGVDFLDIDSYDPEDLKIDFFSADELLNGGNSLVTYYGYDVYGNRTSDNPSFDDFFTAQDDLGNFTRPLAPFRPIYVAGYVQDKFSFDDLVFNIGLRVDRFDANQKVLKDQYVLFPTVKAGEAEALALTEGNHPTNIGSDYVVYVDNVENPSRIVGYRDGDTWFNAEGSELSDASTLRTSNGLPAPLLVDKENTNSVDITSESFEDYTPQTNLLPRIAFSFPISDEALFFAHYDVLTRRPTTGIRLDPSDYFFLESRTNNTINNPALRPEKTIDYEIGFQQKLTNSSSLKLSTFYREFRDQVQIVNVFDAYPRQYRTFGNIDFGTVKGATVTYDLRRTGNMWIKASYTLQFAEGTGSSATSGLNLARTNNPNLRTTIPLGYDQRHTIVATVDYRYRSGADYNGPIWFGKQILANTGANFLFNGGSGEPYSAQSNTTAQGLFNTGSAILDGKINGSRLPWQFKIDARIDRDFELNFGKGEKQRPAGLNVYFQILNVLNTVNIVNVYRATGNPDDDGYLAAPEFQNEIRDANDEQSFRELYSLQINNPANYALPRRLRFGILLSF